MSKVGVYVKCSDGKWYSHPTLGMDMTWFICYDDDDPIELVIAAKSIGSARVKYRIVESHFRKRGCPIEPAGNLRPCGGRIFGKKFKDSYNVWVKLRVPPAELVMDHKGVFDERPDKECVYYD